MPPIAAQRPRARLRSAPSLKEPVTIARLAAEITAAPKPWIARAPIRTRLAVGERAAERGDGEEADADQEDLAAGEEVGGAAGQHQEAGEGERVGVDDPLQAGVGEAERGVDRSAARR